MSYKTWMINITFQEIKFEYETSNMIMDQFEGKETNFYLKGDAMNLRLI